VSDRLKALDLFCGAGGASMGLHRAGFDVYGVDIKYQRNYPFWFLTGNALDVDLSGFDLIWASPPCQKFSAITPADKKADHPDLIPAIRERLKMTGALTVIENVPQAPLRPDLILTGRMFDLALIRRRHFELNFPAVAPGRLSSHYGLLKSNIVEGVYGSGEGRNIIPRWSKAMGIDWMTRRELAQAIPPAYAHWIGATVERLIRSPDVPLGNFPLLHLAKGKMAL